MEQVMLDEILSLLRGYVPQRYLTSQQAAQYLGTNVHTIKEWTRTKRLPFHKPGKGRLFKVADLDRWMAKHASRIL